MVGAEVHLEGNVARHVEPVTEGGCRPNRQGGAQRTAQDAEDGALNQQLPEQLESSRAQGEPEGDFFPAGSGTGKEQVAKLTQEHLDRLAEFVKRKPNSPDAPAAIKTIAQLYDAQGKSVEAEAWRAKLKKPTAKTGNN